MLAPCYASPFLQLIERFRCREPGRKASIVSETPQSIGGEIIHHRTVQLNNHPHRKDESGLDRTGQQGRIKRVHSTGTGLVGDENRQLFTGQIRGNFDHPEIDQIPGFITARHFACQQGRRRRWRCRQGLICSGIEELVWSVLP
jgi:hypothetical protein